MTNQTVVLHTNERGDLTVYSDPGVRVIWCSDLVPHDRLYQDNPGPIPAGLLDGPIGFMNDGSPAAARVSRGIKEANGLPVFEVVPSHD